MNDFKYTFMGVSAPVWTRGFRSSWKLAGYDPKGGDEKCLEYARHKPEIVKRSMEVFSRTEFRVDVLKWKCPLARNSLRVPTVYKGREAYTREEARKHFRDAAAMATNHSSISAGVSIAQFTESLAIASEAGTSYSGVLCGRATWKDVPVYAKHGLKALEEWLQRTVCATSTRERPGIGVPVVRS